MALDRFDDDIKSKLDGHIEEYDSSTWDRLSSILDDSQGGLSEENYISDTEIEDIVKEKLNHLHTPLNEDHWLKLQSELDQLDARKERLWTIKLIEATILLLLLFTYWNFAGYPHYSPLEQDDQDRAESLHFANTDLEKTLSPQSVSGNGHFDNAKSAIVEAIHLADFAKPVIIKNSDNFYRDASSEVSAIEDDAIGLSINSTGETSAASIIDKEDNGVNNDYLQSNDRYVLVDKVDLIDIADLAYDKETSITFAYPTILSDVDRALAENKNKLQNGFWLTLGFAKDVNLINSSVNIQTLSSYLRSGLYGTSASILAGYQINNVEIESGVKFSEKNYAPGLIRSFSKAGVDTYLETQLDEIKFNQIQIPVVAKLHAFNRTQSNLYILAGLGFNVITDYTFNTVKTVQPSSRVASLVDINSNDLSELPYGLTQGGPISDNFYTTAIVGFGFQTLMRNNTAIFFQPQYQFTISEGANDYIRKVHSFNVEAGVRFKF